MFNDQNQFKKENLVLIAKKSGFDIKHRFDLIKSHFL